MKKRLKTFQFDPIMSQIPSFLTLVLLIHHRHRSPVNAFTNLFAGVISYQIRTDKPSLDQLLKLNP